MAQPTSPIAAFARGAGLSGTTSLRKLFHQTTPGFGTLQNFFSTWLNLDITTLAVALTVFGAISTGTQQLKGIAYEVYHWIVRFFTASVSIPGSDRLNREVLNWIGSQVLMRQQTRILTASSEPVQSDAWEFRRAGVKRIDFQQEKRLPIQYLPTFGITWFIYERNIFLVRRVADGGAAGHRSHVSAGSADQYVLPPAGHEPLVVMCLGRSVKPVKRFLEMCREFADKQRESFITVRASRNLYHRETWDTTILRPIRPLETVHMNKTSKDELVVDICNYLKPATRRFYTSRGIPYRRGYLLHGPPGTGKTSLSLALAGCFGLDLYILHVPTLKEDGDLERLFTSLPPQCIVLLEDIDAVGMKRNQEQEDDYTDDEKTKDAKKILLAAQLRHGRVTLSGLLNVLDGVTSQEGRIVIMTSNIAAELDEALVRPGRIDKMIFMGNIQGEAVEEMFLRMYAPDPNDEPNPVETCADMSNEELVKLAAQFRVQIPDNIFTPAQLQGYLLNYRSHPETAVAMIQKWVEVEKTRMDEAKKLEVEAAKLKADKSKERRLQQLATLANQSKNGAQGSTGAKPPGPPQAALEHNGLRYDTVQRRNALDEPGASDPHLVEQKPLSEVQGPKTNAGRSNGDASPKVVDAPPGPHDNQAVAAVMMQTVDAAEGNQHLLDSNDVLSDDLDTDANGP